MSAALTRFIAWLDAWYLSAAIAAQTALDPCGGGIPHLLALREHRRAQLEGWRI